MALAISNIINCPNPQISQRNPFLRRSIPQLSPPNPIARLPRRLIWYKRLGLCAASAAGSSSRPDSDLNPYEVLGVNSFAGFEKVEMAYKQGTT